MPSGVERPALHCPEGPSDTGAYRLSWTVPAGARVELHERKPSGEESLVYEGQDGATTVSGRQEGSHDYRIGVQEGAGPLAWSEGCAVMVSPPALSLALSLFAVGFFVCAATVLAVLRGHRQHREGKLG